MESTNCEANGIYVMHSFFYPNELRNIFDFDEETEKRKHQAYRHVDLFSKQCVAIPVNQYHKYIEALSLILPTN